MNKKIGLLLFCLFTFFVFNLNCYAFDYVIDGYNVDIVVREDNTLSVKETIKVNFNVYKHGIYRIIPLVNQVKRDDGTAERNRVNISKLKVNEEYSTSKDGSQLKIQIGSADRTVIGNKDYVISYDYFLGNDKNKNFDELYFNLIGTNWDTNISNVSFRIEMPKDFDASKLGFTHGGYMQSNTDGIRYEINNNVIVGSFEGVLGDREGLTVRLELPDGYFIKDTWKNHIGEMIFYIIPIIFVIISYFLWVKYGNDDEIIETVEFYAPEGLNSLDVAYIYKSFVNSNDVVSLLVYLANKGYLRIDEGKKKSDFVITKLKDYDGNNKEEQLFFDGLFKHGDVVKKKDLEEKFYTTVNTIIYSKSSFKNKEKMYEKTSSNKRWYIFLFMLITLALSTIFPLIKYDIKDMIGTVLVIEFIMCLIMIVIASINFSSSEKVKLIVSLICGVFVLCVGNYIILFMMDSSLILMDTIYYLGFIICNVAIVILYFFYFIILKRTSYGNMILGKVRGFKNYLESVEKEKLELMVNENPNYFYDILPYTYVFGLSNKWIKKFESIAILPPEWYGTNMDSFDYYRLNKMLDSTIKSVNRTLVSQPNPEVSSFSSSSGGSSGGFSGGGFSGGGSGGGGGGSW